MSHQSAHKKSGGKIVNSHLSFSRSRLCDGTCLMCQAMLERQLTTGANHSCTRRHAVPDIFSHLGDSWPNAPTSLFGQPIARQTPKGKQVRPLLVSNSRGEQKTAILISGSSCPSCQNCVCGWVYIQIDHYSTRPTPPACTHAPLPARSPNDERACDMTRAPARPHPRSTASMSAK